MSNYLEQALQDAQLVTCFFCGTKVHQYANIDGWQCCEKNLIAMQKAGYALTPNAQIKNLRES